MRFLVMIVNIHPKTLTLGDFDRWLAEHDRDIAWKAWEKGHDDGGYDNAIGDMDHTPNPYEESNE